MVSAIAFVRRNNFVDLGLMARRRFGSRADGICGAAKGTKRFLDYFSWRANGLGGLLGDAQFEYSGLYPLRTLAKVADGRPGPRLAPYHDRVCVYRRRCHECNSS